MLLGIFFFVLIFGWFSVNGIVRVPPVYRKAEVVLKQYKSNPSHNPIIHSLFNAFIHDKRARAFISDQAIELALQQVKELDQQSKTKNAKTLRRIIYHITCKRTGKYCSSIYQQTINRPPSELKQRIASALDKFFANAKFNDEGLILADNQS